jgi:tetratricopeptide (TPR) repeat protein
MTFLQGDGAGARPLLEESAAISREQGDTLGLAYASYMMGIAMAFGGDPEGSAINLEGITLFRRLGDEGKPGLVLALLTRGVLALLQGDFATSRTLFEEDRILSRELGDQYALAQVSNYLGDIARIESDYSQAGSLYEESLNIMRDQGGRSDIPALLHNMGYVALAEHDYERAWELLNESLALQQEMGNKQGISECLTGFAALAGAQGYPQRAARLFGAAEALRLAINAYMWPAERVEWERHIAIARAQLEEATWEAAWQEGVAMKPERAVDYALSTS